MSNLDQRLDCRQAWSEQRLLVVMGVDGVLVPDGIKIIDFPQLFEMLPSN